MFIYFTSLQGKGVLSKILVWFPQIKTCVSEQAFPLSPCICLLWSLHIQTGENNFSNCRLNWQAWISRLYLRVLSCQVARQFSVAPESHYSLDGHWDFHFPITVLNPIFHCRWFQLPRLGGEGWAHTCSHFAMLQGGFFVSVHVCLQTVFMKFIHWWPWASKGWGVPQGSSQHTCPMGLYRGNAGSEFFSRLRMKLLIETGNKNNETTRSQKSKDFRVERDHREHLT